MARRLSSGARLDIYDQIDSTNREARRRTEAGESGPLWILAGRQTDGYGRRGTAWLQSEGDVAATLLFEPAGAPGAWPQLSLVAAVALADALASFAPGAPISLKWPNDVLLARGKIAGLLLELIATPSGGSVICLGFGVNVVSRPEGVDYPAARLGDALEDPPTPAAIVERLDEAFSARLADWERSGFESARRDWLARAAGIGAKISVRAPRGNLTGIFRDISAEGALLIETPEGLIPVHAGAISPPGGT